MTPTARADVPGVQWIRQPFEVRSLGTCGITSDRQDKVMILLTGKVMNERTHIGAVTARDSSMMDDIHRIEVIRGAGSAVYGLGAFKKAGEKPVSRAAGDLVARARAALVVEILRQARS